MHLAARFWSKVKKGAGCWEWTGCILRSGYGQVRPDGGKKHALAHRVAWELAVGPIPDGVCVLHHCDNPRCVRPDHLFLGSLKDNSADCARKGRCGFQQPGRIARPQGENHGLARLTSEQIAEIHTLSGQGFSQPRLGQLFGVAHSTIGRVLRGETWRHIEGGLVEVRQ